MGCFADTAVRVSRDVTEGGRQPWWTGCDKRNVPVVWEEYRQGRSLRGGARGGNCPPWDFQFLWFFKLIIPKSNTEIATWYLLRRHCPPAYLGQATALIGLG